MLLRTKDLEKLRAIFSVPPIAFEVWAYGSRVNGDAHEGSDLDLVIRGHNLQKIPIDVFLDLKDKIQQSTIPIVVELFDWARLPQNFQHNIEDSHEVLFSNLKTMTHESGLYSKNDRKKNDELNRISNDRKN